MVWTILYLLRSSKLVLFSLLLLLLSFLVIPEIALAQKAKMSLSLSPSPTPMVANSYELFWPLVSGKTADDGFVYSLKKLKENFRGMLIFGNVEKANYLVFLATKRVLEAEKLINENKYELANKTFDDALNQLSEAEEKIQGFSRSEKISARNKETVSKASNIEKLATFLASRENGSSGKLSEVANKASSIAKKLQD